MRLVIFNLLVVVDIALAWTGPVSSITHDSHGRTAISVGSTTLLPLFLSLNSQSSAVSSGNWTIFDYEVGLAAAASIPLLEVCLLNTSPSFLASLVDHLASFPGYLVFRVDLYAPEDGLPLSLLADVHGQTSNSAFYTLSPTWLAHKQQMLQAVLPSLDAAFPGRVVAVRPTYLEGGEWFTTPVTAGGSAPGTNGSFPWNSDLFYYMDYAPDAVSAFCAWPALPLELRVNCSIPAVNIRLSANTGNMFIQGLDPESARAVMFVRFLASRVASTLIGLAQTIKAVSDGKCLSMFFYGYLFELGWDVLSGHHALAQLLAAPEIDILSAPYSYGASRTLAVGFQPHGPADAEVPVGKLFIHEDDTRTCLCALEPACVPDPLWVAHNISDTVTFIRRNGMTSVLRGNGLYYFDLWGYGWYGRPDAPEDSVTLWQAITSVVEAAQKLDLTKPQAAAFRAQVLVFVDEITNSHTPVAGAAGPNAYTVATSFLEGTAVDLTLLGAPLRLHLLTDILDANFSADGAVLCVLLNAFSLTNVTRVAIKGKLFGGGRTVAFVHAAGIMDADSLVADPAQISALLGIDVQQGAGSQRLLTTLSSSDAGSYGFDFPVAPWFFVADTGAQTLGTYAANGQPSLVRKSFSNHSVVYSGSPGLPAILWRELALTAGVHLYSSVAGDIVEAAGNSLMILTEASGVRTVTLPVAAQRVVEDVNGTEVLVCTACISFAVNLPAREVHLYRAY
jgi:hypothetical protein